MILTLTINAALDRVFFIHQFEPGSVMQAERVVDSVGGKGLCASVALSSLGIEQLAMGFVAGNSGRMLVGLLERYGIPHDLIWVEGETRTVNVVVETALARHSHLTTPGYAVQESDLQELERCWTRRLPSADWAVIAGSQPSGAPPGLYARCIRAAKAQGVKTLVDCQGEAMRQAVAVCPNITKMNVKELSVTFGLEVQSFEDLIEKSRNLLQYHQLEALVITWGARGILALADGMVYHAQPPELQPKNAAGAGDAVSGALAYRFSQGDSWIQALQWAAAMGAASVLTQSTGECDPTDVAKLYPQVAVKVLS